MAFTLQGIKSLPILNFFLKICQQIPEVLVMNSAEGLYVRVRTKRWAHRWLRLQVRWK